VDWGAIGLSVEADHGSLMQEAAVITDDAATRKPDSALSGHYEPEPPRWRWHDETTPGLNGLSRMEESIEGRGGGVRQRIDPVAVSGAKIGNDESLPLRHAASAARETEADRKRHSRPCRLTLHGVSGDAPVVRALIRVESREPLWRRDSDADQHEGVRGNRCADSSQYRRARSRRPRSAATTAPSSDKAVATNRKAKARSKTVTVDVRQGRPQSQSTACPAPGEMLRTHKAMQRSVRTSAGRGDGTRLHPQASASWLRARYQRFDVTCSTPNIPRRSWRWAFGLSRN
jgi:hypothetical protein